MRPSVLVALAVLLVACAPARQSAVRDLVRGIDSERPAVTAQIPEREIGSFLQRAVTVLQAEGLRIAARSATQVVTAPRELDLRCGVELCRVRELAMVHVSGSTARLQLLRAVRSPSDRHWQLALTSDVAEDAASREARLLQAMLGTARARIQVSQR